MSTLLEMPTRKSSIGGQPFEERLAVRSMRAIGTTATVAVTDPTRADAARDELAGQLAVLDATCSRFRSDSELRRVECTSAGSPAVVSALLYELLEVGCAVAALTAGTVDPTVGATLAALGYDRDFDQVRRCGAAVEEVATPAPGWWRITLDPTRRTVVIPEGVRVDLGATAKAFAADHAARSIAELTDCGVLVNLGGDVAVAGAGPSRGWPIGIASEHTTAVADVDEVVRISSGALATSGTTARSWHHGGRSVHHIVDPWTGESCEPVWSLVSTVAPSCVEANAFSTAAVVWGEDAPGNLAARDVGARLAGRNGPVVYVGEWPRPARFWHATGAVG